MDLSKLIPPVYSENECYEAGFDSGLNGSNSTNCHFSYFATKEKMERWEKGSKDGEQERLYGK